jgi:epoxyqueuosine reductase
VTVREADDADLPALVESTIAAFLADPSKNNLGPGHPQPAWGDFLVGYSAGDDPLYETLKQVIGRFHWSPAEAFSLAARESSVPSCEVPAAAGELTVVSWALCQTESTKAANRAEKVMPAESWARARIFGQAANVALHREVGDALVARGFAAVAPALSACWTEFDAMTDRWASSWSERHVAYVCGLGTFGLCGGLITKKGKAVRLGSLVIRANIPPTKRAYSGPFDHCLHYSRGACGVCAERCPTGSVEPNGHDKNACARHLRPRSEEYVREKFGFEGYACGLCQTGVPCESGIPEELAAV